MMKNLFLLAVLGLMSVAGFAQTSNVGAIRGVIVDKQSQYPVVGAQVLITSLDPIKGAVTDDQGYVRIEDVPVGRLTVQVRIGL